MSKTTTLPSFSTLEAMIESTVKDFTGEIMFVGDKDFSEATDRVAAEVRRVRVSLSEGRSLDLFVKASPDGTTGAELSSSLRTFEKECYFYSDLAKRMRDFVAESSSSSSSEDELLGFMMKCYGVGTVAGLGIVIILEDMISSGFEVTSREAFHSRQQAKTCLRSIAEFHAVTRAMLRKGALVEDEEPLLDDFLSLDMTVMAEYFWKPAVSYLKMMGHIAANGQGSIKIPDNVSAELLLELSTLPAATITQEFRRARRDSGPDCGMGPVLCHGDFHMWNVAFNKESDDGGVRFFDFQIIFVGSFAADLHQYLSQVTKPNDRIQDGGLDELLGCYHESFVKTAKLLSNGDVGDLPTFDALRAAYKSHSVVSFVFAMNWLLVRLVRDPVKLQQNPIEWWDDCTRSGHCDQDTEAVQIMFDFVAEMESAGAFGILRGSRGKSSHE